MRSFLSGISIALMLCLYGVQASETEALPDSEEPLQPIGFFGTVTGSVEFGFLLTSGNTDSFAIRANSDLVHDLQYFRNKYQLHSLIQKNNVLDSQTNQKNRVTTANRYGLSGQSNYKLVTGRESIFGRGSYSYDRFGAFREQATVAGGYGNRMYEKQQSYLDLETGPGFAYQRSASGNNNSGAIWFFAANLDYALFDNTRFRQTLEGALSLNSQNSTVLSRSSITAKIIDKLSMRFNFVVRHNSHPEQNLNKTDTETSASLVYTF